jgi:hypothetical protein
VPRSVALTGLDVLWRALDQRPPNWDQARHLGDGLVYDHLFSLAHPLRFLAIVRGPPPAPPPAGFRAAADYTLPDGEQLELYERD